jgi:hypothetical protein
MRELSDGRLALRTIRELVKACKPPKVPRPKRPKLTPAERRRSRIRGRYRGLLTRLREAEAIVAASKTDWSRQLAAIPYECAIPGLRMEIACMRRDSPTITAEVDAELNTNP